MHPTHCALGKGAHCDNRGAGLTLRANVASLEGLLFTQSVRDYLYFVGDN